MAILDYGSKYRSLPRRLLDSLKNNTPGHSYIFHGDTIEEIREFAMEWIKTSVCQQLGERGACGLCRHCQVIDSGNYPELNVIEPQSKSRTILVDAVRKFQNRFYLKAAAGVTKVGLIVEADRMQIQAQNAFLKTLEEPPPGTLLILLTTRLDALLNTIRSRCRLVSLAANRVFYEDELKNAVTSSLASLSGKDGAGRALIVLEEFKSLFAGLKKKAQQEIESGFPISDQEAEDPALKKKYKEKIVVLTEGRYRLYREQIVSMVEVWIAQNFLKVNGVQEDQLSYPELSAESWSYDENDAGKSLNLIEGLKRDLVSNVNEDLALENFFLQICQK